MKKFLAIFLLLAMLVSMTACGATQSNGVLPTNPPAGGNNDNNNENKETEGKPSKSDAVVAVEKLIEAIGEVSENSLDDITTAEEAYKALSSSEKAQVENAAVLTAARDAYDQLVVAKEAAEVIAKIDAIGTVSSSKLDQVLEVVRLYNSCSKNVQKAVTNYDVLKDAATTLANKMLSKMDCDEDFVRNINFYYPEAFPWGEDGYWYADEGCFVLPYMGVSGNQVWLRLVCNYNSWDWIFFEKITYAVDSERYYDYFNYFDVVRDNSGGEIWEYVDMEVGASEIEMLWAIANSNKTVIRFEGDDYYDDYTVTSKQKQSIRDMLIVYELLNL